MELIYRIVRRLLRDDEVEFSRNRNFAAYEDASVQRAARIHRHLRSVEGDLLALDDPHQVRLVALERDQAGALHLTLSMDARGAQRTSVLTGREWALLLENGQVSQILRGLLDELDPDTRAELEALLAASDSEQDPG